MIWFIRGVLISLFDSSQFWILSYRVFVFLIIKNWRALVFIWEKNYLFTLILRGHSCSFLHFFLFFLFLAKSYGPDTILFPWFGYDFLRSFIQYPNFLFSKLKSFNKLPILFGPLVSKKKRRKNRKERLFVLIFLGFFSPSVLIFAFPSQQASKFVFSSGFISFFT